MRGPDLSRFDLQHPSVNDSIAPRAIITMALSYATACMTLGLRLWSPGVKTKKLGWDDGMVVLAMVCYHPPLYILQHVQGV
jgi:hypothetical protein